MTTEAFTTSDAFRQSLRDIRPFLAGALLDGDPKDIYERLLEHESRLIAGKRKQPLMEDYVLGTAHIPDEILTLDGRVGASLVSAEHATDVFSKKFDRLRGADHGTAALASLLHEELGTTSIIPLGRQTGNGNVDVQHPIKDVIHNKITGSVGYVSVHGMTPGKILDYTDENEIHAIIGLGVAPTKRSRDIAEKIVGKAKDEVGLTVVIGNDIKYLTTDPDTGKIKLSEDGQPVRSTLAAEGEGRTTNFVNEQGLDIPALQLEITRGLRLVPSDFAEGWKIGDKAKIAGVYAGYALTRLIVSMMSSESGN
jgi:hypothetical protein